MKVEDTKMEDVREEHTKAEDTKAKDAGAADAQALAKWVEGHQDLQQEMEKHYHYLHQHPEVGMDLPMTSKYVYDTLCSYGYQPIWMAGCGMYVLAGQTGENQAGKPTLLLRADMDALPMKEETDLPYRSLNDCMHSCGHDMHTSMMLGVARLLKEQEANLKGCVKIMFQPDEEGLSGCMQMIEEGILENPKVNAALSMHVEASTGSCGMIRYREKENTAASTIFDITVKGKSTHGAQPHTGIDPINTAVRIYLAFQELIARELPASSANVLTVGMLQGGTARNIIPEEAMLKCSLRTFDEEERTFIMKRVKEICDGMALAYRTPVSIDVLNYTPCLYNDPELSREIMAGIKDLFGSKIEMRTKPLTVSEDFSQISQRVPSCFVMMTAGSPEEGYCWPQHNAKVTFDEKTMIHGCCYLYESAVRWLERHGA